ncbi:HAMP domain-containing sensor histidine kinase [Gelidibacter sp.]|uniref:sensor histidine kinase n=1 Tax=Gelidibacter sp. TaxID=2018083 RepID=UPI003263AC83
MKLLNHTTKYFAFLLIVLISIWAVIFYVAMLDEIYDSLDDGLEHQKILIIQEAKKDPTLLNTPHFGIGNFTIKSVSNQKNHKLKNSYRDTLMYRQNEKENEPVRILESSFELDGSYYKIKLITSMVEQDDQIRNLFIYLTALYFVLIASIILLNNLILKKVWEPFYDLIGKLKEFRIESGGTIDPVSSNIDEFELLNQSVKMLTKKSVDTYSSQKEFIENASHELQTPLAIAINSLELLLDKNGLSQEQSSDIGAVLKNLERLKRLNKSLLLLSKIDNQQFIEEENIDFKQLISEVTEGFSDFAAHRAIDFNVDLKNGLNFIMNRDLANMLLTNLIKNAIWHGEQGRTVEIGIRGNSIYIRNFGGDVSLDQVDLFKRFKKISFNKTSTGLGLAISKAIANKYRLHLEYNFAHMHEFQLQFPSK